MHLTPEQKAIGQQNFYSAVGSQFTRRDFLVSTIALGGVAGVAGAGLGWKYFGYGKEVGNPVRVGIIGTGDEGGVLIGALNPNYVQVVAIADIRPYNIYRAFHGDPGNSKARPGLVKRYGYDEGGEEAARKDITVYDTDYMDLLNDPNVEGVIIALPLHLHGKVAIEAMRAGKHVLTEKLMAHDITQCKEMARVARDQKKLLATGHQRHYSMLYDNAVDTIGRGLIGDVHHIRAQWHRPKDTWSADLPGTHKNANLSHDIEEFQKKLAAAIKDGNKDRIKAVQKKLDELEKKNWDARLEGKAADYGYQSKTLPGGYECAPLEELIRWRLWDRTGGGLMAELGSHQLDAASIFISAMRTDGEHVQPLSVTGVGGRHLYEENRDTDDHVYCSFEFPAVDYAKDPNKKVVVTYSSINGNGFGGYGEIVMGTKGTLLLENEKDVMLYSSGGTSTKVGVKEDKKGISLDAYESTADAAVGKTALTGEISRGYTEEIEHWAWCIRNFDESAFASDPNYKNLPRCHPEVAMADAIIALTSNIAMNQQKRIEFNPKWFDIDDDATPEVDHGVEGARSPDKLPDDKLSKYPKSRPGSEKVAKGS